MTLPPSFSTLIILSFLSCNLLFISHLVYAGKVTDCRTKVLTTDKAQANLTTLQSDQPMDSNKAYYQKLKEAEVQWLEAEEALKLCQQELAK